MLIIWKQSITLPMFLVDFRLTPYVRVLSNKKKQNFNFVIKQLVAFKLNRNVRHNGPMKLRC